MFQHRLNLKSVFSSACTSRFFSDLLPAAFATLMQSISAENYVVSVGEINIKQKKQKLKYFNRCNLLIPVKSVRNTHNSESPQPLNMYIEASSFNFQKKTRKKRIQGRWERFRTRSPCLLFVFPSCRINIGMQ